MAINTQTIRIDLNTGRTIPVAFAHQNDTNRQLTFQLYNNGVAFTPSSTTVKFAYKSPIVNGRYSVITGSQMASGTVSGNTVTVTLPAQYTQVSGVGLLTMILTTSGNTLRPVNIKFVCQGSADGDDTILNASDWPDGLYDYMDNWMAENEPTEIANLKSDLEYKTSDITRKLEYVRSENLCRGDDTVTSGYMAQTGNVYSSGSFVYTDKIPVNEGETIRVYNTQSGTFAQRSFRFITAFDASGNVITASGSDASWNYTVPSGVSSIVISMAIGTDYMVAVGAVRTAYIPYDGYYKATEDFIGDLLSSKVDKLGAKQVTSDNIEDLVKTGYKTKSANIFSEATLLGRGKYVDAGYETGKLILRDNANYDSYIIAVDDSTYQLSGARFALLLASDMETYVGSLLSNVTEVVTTGASYLAFSFNVANYSADTFVVTKTVDVYTATNWIFGDTKKPIDKKSGSISQNGTMSISGRSALKDGELITFKGFFDTFAEFALQFIGFTTSTITNYIKVDATNITIKNTTTTPTPQAHGLTIQNDVTLTAQFIDGTMKITLCSNGESWTNTVQWYQTSGTVTEPQVAPNGMTFTDATLVVSYDAVKRSIWYFGDSYTGITSQDRWVYYLKEDGFSGNALINGSAGGVSSGASIALSALLKYGVPKFAVMATGMNDGSDTDGNPPNLWSSNRDAFITDCQNNGIEPIFATIPTVPTVNNEAKNAWVKASGYRYIDFAKAVGADGTGAWYSGMLSSDNVHPTAKGAKALYTQVLIDLPEITISD